MNVAPSNLLQEPIDDVERWQKKDQPKDYRSDIQENEAAYEYNQSSEGAYYTLYDHLLSKAPFQSTPNLPAISDCCSARHPWLSRAGHH